MDEVTTAMNNFQDTEYKLKMIKLNLLWTNYHYKNLLTCFLLAFYIIFWVEKPLKSATSVYKAIA